ncbi:hypothetical protein KBTX_01625 [wastewater metagenome]|uniref:Transglycosylase SLT domain-containing protein n=2 Tax=unclassified sequences TaxID=12908 RepID=A0A5B8REQ2_9ZZZZ|nr:hypothetical protein KBTEX_01625 [uncultured organism]
MSLTQAQENVRDEIVAYGRERGFSKKQIQIAVNVAFIESSLGQSLSNPDSTAPGLFQYLDDSWETYHGDLGEKNSQGNQLRAF